MKEFLFISDFDGTLTDRDFYLIIIEKFLHEQGHQIIEKWQNGELSVFDFLSTVFRSINRSEAEVQDAILGIAMDPYAKTFIEHIKKAGGDFVILSAGTSYYIERFLEHIGIKNVLTIANPGVFSNGGIQMTSDTSSPFYSKEYGIDKSLVVRKFKQEYRKVFYAGDSEPDLKAALLADRVFAKGKLPKFLEERKYPFIPFKSFKEIEQYLIKESFIEPALY